MCSPCPKSSPMGLTDLWQFFLLLGLGMGHRQLLPNQAYSILDSATRVYEHSAREYRKMATQYVGWRHLGALIYTAFCPLPANVHFLHLAPPPPTLRPLLLVSSAIISSLCLHTPQSIHFSCVMNSLRCFACCLPGNLSCFLALSTSTQEV